MLEDQRTLPREKNRSLNRGGRFFIQTFGCQMNESDSEHIAGLLRSQGWEKVDSPEKSNLILVNTCAVREKSVEKLFSFLGRLKRIKEKTGVKIAVVGCVAQLEGEELFNHQPFIDYVLGPDNYLELTSLLNRQEAMSLTNRSAEWREHPSPLVLRESRVSAYVPVMEGCNNFCSYCIVPFARGREKYRSAASVLKEVELLTGLGYLEIQLLGQSITSYRDPETGISLAELLRLVSGVKNIRWVRFITSHPKDLNVPIARVMGEESKVCRQLHLPVQSGSTSVLRRMKRGYTREEYLEKVAMLREFVPRISLSTDIIVGFPGETEEEFEETLSLLEAVRFTNIFSFRYSPRPYTAASRLPDDVPFEVKRRRLIEVQSLQKKIQVELNAGLVGQEMDVLCSGRSTRTPELYTGRNEAYQVVNFTSSQEATNNFVRVRITSYGPYSLRGEALD